MGAEGRLGGAGHLGRNGPFLLPSLSFLAFPARLVVRSLPPRLVAPAPACLPACCCVLRLLTNHTYTPSSSARHDTPHFLPPFVAQSVALGRHHRSAQHRSLPAHSSVRPQLDSRRSGTSFHRSCRRRSSSLPRRPFTLASLKMADKALAAPASQEPSSGKAPRSWVPRACDRCRWPFFTLFRDLNKLTSAGRKRKARCGTPMVLLNSSDIRRSTGPLPQLRRGWCHLHS